uniref:Uncharacterized protein n=1 Tax=Echeneis naucrates TaxID=173247 RepID=A0A665UQE2_ECHNA
MEDTRSNAYDSAFKLKSIKKAKFFCVTYFLSFAISSHFSDTCFL